MIKYLYFILFSLSLFSQEPQIATQFFQDGKIYKELNENLNELINPIGQFAENESCVVVKFLGRDNYKIKYKDHVGIVKMDDLEVNEDIMDLYYAYQDEERLKLIEAEKARKKKVYQIVHEEEIEKRKQDSIAKSISDAKAFKEALESDSIAKSIAKQKEIAAALEIKRANETYLAKQKAQEEKRKRDLLMVAITEKKVLEDRRIKDSISKSLAKQKELEAAREIKRANEAHIAEQKAIEEQRKRDSLIVAITKQKAIKDSIAKSLAQQKELEAALEIKRANEAYVAQKRALEEKRIQDSIAKVLEIEKAFEAMLVKDSIAKSLAKQKELEAALELKRANEAYLAEQKALSDEWIVDSVALKALYKKQIKDSLMQNMIIQKKQYEKRIKDSLIRALSAEKNINSDVSAVETSLELSEKERLRLERIKYKDSCSYEINDYDVFYNVHTIRTNKYQLNDVLTVELYRQGHKVNVFFNAEEDLGCVSYFSHNRSSVKLNLENGKNITFYHSWNMECGTFSFKGNLSKSQILALQESPIKEIKLKGTKGSVLISDIVYPEFFIDKLKCIE